MSKVTGKMAEQVNDVYNWMKDKNAHNGQSSLVLEEMPILVHLYGRDAVVSQVARTLTTTPRLRVGILGAGGMDKTSVAVALMENELIGAKYQELHRFWAPCVGITSIDTFLQILSKSLRVSQDSGTPLKDILYTLKSTQDSRLILFDNLETAMCLPEVILDGGRLSVEGIINQIARIPYVSILVTIRSNSLLSDTIAWELVHLEDVAREDARMIFTSICPTAAGHSSLNTLLEALGYMPYAVALLSKLPSGTNQRHAKCAAERLGRPMAIAHTLELSGHMYGLKGDLLGARLGYEQAKKVYSEMEETVQRAEPRDHCNHNSQLIEGAKDGKVELTAPSTLK
ncbi:hypothetical protein FRC14_004917 [Serendipita sp. 396]|nr:hypothetical protein FRC14_004917 [Serendipita sp. 396]